MLETPDEPHPAGQRGIPDPGNVACAVLRELGRHPEGLTTSEVASNCGLHRSIANRLLVSLLRTAFAARQADGRYTVGPAIHDLVEGSRPQLRTVAEPVLHRLATIVDATASLVEVVGDHAVTTVVAEPPTDGPEVLLSRRQSRSPGARRWWPGGPRIGPPDAGEPDRVAATRVAGHITTHGELNPGAHGAAAPLPGWGRLAAIVVVTSDRQAAERAVQALLSAAQEIVAAGSAGAAEATPAAVAGEAI